MGLFDSENYYGPTARWDIGDFWRRLFNKPTAPKQGVPDFEAERDAASDDAAAAMKPIYEQINTLLGQAQDIPTFGEWLAQQGRTATGERDSRGNPIYEGGMTLQDLTGAYDAPLAGIQEIIDRIGAGPSEADLQAGYENAARLMGLDSAEEAQMILGNLSRRLGGYTPGMTEEELQQSGVLENFQGLSPEQKAAMEAQNRAIVREAEDRAQRLVQNTIADTGSTARMLASAAEANQQISNLQVQQQAALVQADMDARIMEFNSNVQTWQNMVSANQMGTQQYLDAVFQGANTAIQGYMGQMEGIYRQNQTYFDAYQADMTGMMNQIQATYSALQLQLGATQQELDMAQQLYDQQVQPYIDDLNAQLVQQELTFGWDDIWDGIVTVVGVVLGTGGISSAPSEWSGNTSSTGPDLNAGDTYGPWTPPGAYTPPPEIYTTTGNGGGYL